MSILLAVCLLTVGAAGKATETLTLHLVAYVPEKTQVAVGRNGDPFIRTTGTPEDFQLDEWTETYSGGAMGRLTVPSSVVRPVDSRVDGSWTRDL